MPNVKLAAFASLLLALVTAGCGGGSAMCNVDTNAGCSSDRVCETVRGSSSQTSGCFAPVEIQGRVFDLANNTAIAGARVVAIDASGAAASGVAMTDAMGGYALRIPTARNADGTIASAPTYTLRADAQGFQSFPGGVRPALPVDTSMTTMGARGPLIHNATTDVGLIHLPAAPRGSIAGSVQGNSPGGVLVVAQGATGISDRDGAFVVFNVPAGVVTVRGYAANVQLNPAMATVTDGMQTTGVTLSPASGATATVTGSIQLVNAGGVTDTSVVLVVRETYNAVLDRGEVPRGLRASQISGAFSIAGVPAGEYVVLAAFENDGAVRDPDPGIAGTDIVTVTVPVRGSVALPQSFKVTGALNHPSPGGDAPAAVTTLMPTFSWDDDSSEDGYELRVFDSFGSIVWENLTVPAGHGAQVSAAYAGPALTPGMYYQFRATSFRDGRAGMPHAPISRTEELRGVFYIPSR